ncbi:MAG: DUF2188 domain-containing protein [Hyphomicrobium sp.]|jgi:hypothetical protein
MPKKLSPPRKNSRNARLQLFVVPDTAGWTIKSSSTTKVRVRAYPTQKQAQEAARTMIRASQGGEIVTRDRRGRIKDVDTYVLGDAAARTISAVEGIHLTQEMAKDFRELDRLKLSTDERRRWLISKYAKPYSKRRGV